MEYLDKAAEIHTRQGSASEIARDIWRRAAVLAEMGNYETAFREFAEARRRIVALDLKQDAVSLDLYYLRAKVAAGADHRELHAISSRLAADAVAARLPVTACEAIDWLRRISRRLTPAAVDHVRSFISKAERKPDLAFEPPDA